MTLGTTVQQALQFLQNNPEVAQQIMQAIQQHPEQVSRALAQLGQTMGATLSDADIAALKSELLRRPGRPR